MSDHADAQFGRFLSGLPPNQLQDLEVISNHQLARESFRALNHHALSLKELKISNLREESLTSLDEFKDCTSLRTLRLDDLNGTTPLESRHNDIFLSLRTWLTSLPHLKSLHLQRLLDSPLLLHSLLLTPTIHLEKLTIIGYTAATQPARDLHSALAHHPSLTSLSIKADGDDMTPTDRNSLVTSLCKLPHLRELELKDISDEFTNSHITTLATHLPLLEYLWVSGDLITDAVLPALAQLRQLRTLMFMALTRFTVEALLDDFVANLEGPGNWGFNLNVLNECGEELTEDGVGVVREAIAAKVEGSFEFSNWRDPDVSEFEGESD
ncbi:MAG: hypothetical protein Q9227_008763 [Pyrenula ochraceoflavens]